LDELICERVFAIALGYSTQDDVGHRTHYPVLRAAVGNRSGNQVLEEPLASQPTQSRLNSNPTGGAGTLETLRDGPSESINQHVHTAGGKRVRRAAFDIDSFHDPAALNRSHPTRI